MCKNYISNFLSFFFFSSDTDQINWCLKSAFIGILVIFNTIARLGSQKQKRKLSQVRQTKWQPPGDLGTRVHLRTSKMRDFTLLNYLTCTCSLAYCPNLMFTSSQLLLPAKRALLVQENWAESHACLYCAATELPRVGVSGLGS